MDAVYDTGIPASQYCDSIKKGEKKIKYNSRVIVVIVQFKINYSVLPGYAMFSGSYIYVTTGPIDLKSFNICINLSYITNFFGIPLQPFSTDHIITVNSHI